MFINQFLNHLPFFVFFNQIDYLSVGKNNSIFCYNISNGQVSAAYIENEFGPSFIVPVGGCKNQFAVGLENVVKIIKWDGISSSAQVIRSLPKVERDIVSHFTYALVDPKGRLYTGTHNKEKLCSASPDHGFYLFSKLAKPRRVLKHTRLTTGIAINRNENKLYFADPCCFNIVEYDWDPKTGEICKYYPFSMAFS